MAKARETRASTFIRGLAREKLISKGRRPPPVADLARAAREARVTVPARELAAVRDLGAWAETYLPHTQRFPSPLEPRRGMQCVPYSKVAASLGATLESGNAELAGIAILYEEYLPALVATPELPGGWGWIAFTTDRIDPIALNLEDLAIYRWSGLSSYLEQCTRWPGSSAKEAERAVAKQLPKEPETIALLRYAMERYQTALDAWKGCTDVRVVPRQRAKFHSGPDTLAEACALQSERLRTLGRILGSAQPETDEAAIANALRKIGAPFVYAKPRRAKITAQPTSVLGGSTWARRGETWPTDGDRPLDHLLTVRTDEARTLPEALEGIALIEIFSNDFPSEDARKIPTDGDSLVIRAYDSLRGLVPLRHPMRPRAKSSAIAWETGVDYPAPHVARSSLKALRVRADADEIESVMDDEALEHYAGTKLGGWPTLVQSEVTPKGFALQLIEGPFGDSGTLYVHRVRGGWQAQWYCY